MMRVLVLGADGFVGRAVVAALAGTGWAEPVAGVRRGTGPGRIVLNATDAGEIARALSGIDAVVNCVTGDRRTIEGNAAALFDAAAGRRIVHLSSMAVYGAATGRIDETAPLRADTDDYAAAKIAAERQAHGVANVVLLRPGCIYGAGGRQWSWRIARLLAARRIGDLGAGGDGCSNLVHVGDVAAAVCAALRIDPGPRAVFNLAMPDAPDWNGYFLAFARALGTVPIAHIPEWRMRVETALAVPLTLAETVHASAPPPIPPSLARFWRRDIRIDPAQASARLGITWTPLDTGVADAAYWCASRLGRRTDP